MATRDRLAHYQASMGNIPAPIATMFDMDEDFADHYTDIREQIYTSRDDGLPLAVKELLLTMFDLSVSNPDGGINHLRAAHRAGLTATQLKEALLIAFLVLGVGGWGKVGYKLWDAFQGFDGEEGARNGHAS